MAAAAAASRLPTELVRAVLDFLPARVACATCRETWLRGFPVVHPSSPDAAFVLRFYLNLTPADVGFRVRRDCGSCRGGGGRGAEAEGGGQPASGLGPKGLRSGDASAATANRALLGRLMDWFADASCLGPTELAAFRELRHLARLERAAEGRIGLDDMR